MTLNSITLGDYIFQSDMRNANNIYGANDVKGIATSKAFIETKANLHGVLLSNYKVVSPSQFAYVPDTSRRGDKISLGYNDSDDTYLVSSISIVFGIKAEKANELLSEYLFLYFCRPEFDRYARFHSWGSARETFSWNDMCKIKISLPPIAVQRKYVAVFKALLANHNGSEDIKSICPVLIKGAIEEEGR